MDIKVLQLIAAQGDADAQFNLVVMYHTGQGVPQDYTQAVRWARLAADQGHTKAQNILGWRRANPLHR